MLLQKLNEYADRLSLPPVLYSEAPVRYIIELDATGHLLNPVPTDTADPGSPATRRGQRRLVPQVQRSSGIKPLLLADNGEYTLGLARDPSKQVQVDARHEAYMDLLRRCIARTREPSVEAVLDFLSGDPAAQLELPDEFDRGATTTFRVDGVFPIDRPAVQLFWADENDPGQASGGPKTIMQCLVCGEERPVLDRLQGKIKGVPGGQTSGTSIISANAEAFESYGLSASLIAPTCASCGERFTKAINDLLSDPASSIRIAGTVFVFWTRERVSFSFRTHLTDPKPEEVRALLDSVRSGRLPGVKEDQLNTRFYGTALTGSGARTVVRDWIDTTILEAGQHLATWFERQRLIGDYGEERAPFGLYALAGATVRELKDLPPAVPRSLLRSALVGTPLPYDLLYQAVRRNRAEQRVTAQRAALIKLVLLSHDSAVKEGAMVQLDQSNSDPAYLCGRLLAVLEEVQRAAIPTANATIVDRFFGTASSAPASVFGRLLRGAQPHLSKLERDRRGAYRALQRRLEDILSGLGGFPRTLTLESQGLFALGYYHQRAFDRAQAREASERRKAGMAPSDDEDLIVDPQPAEEGSN